MQKYATYTISNLYIILLYRTGYLSIILIIFYHFFLTLQLRAFMYCELHALSVHSTRCWAEKIDL